ncbi:hypothetical protein H8V63_003319 [Vibrio parahaemolyticus]|nr:hypothetical protein [Vibrio parahaemolyticus]EII3602242.1 hypothetical protein [Vibrio parahaemolyticus]
MTEQDVLLIFYFEPSVRLMRVTTVFIVVQGLSTSQLENLLKTLEERLTGLAFRNTKRGKNELASVAVSS